jgi:hypothetical protein
MKENILKNLNKLAAGALATTLLVACGNSRPKQTDSNISRSIEAKKDAEAQANPEEEIDLTSFFWDVDFTFVRPGVDDLKDVETSVPVEIASESAPSQMTWSLFYNKAYMSPEGGIAIAEDMPIATKSVTWDTTAVERGTYFLFAVLKLQTTSSIRYFGSAVAVEKGGAENRTPFVSLLPGIEGTAYLAGNIVPVKFLAADPDGQEVTFSVEYSSDLGKKWNKVISGLKRDSTQVTFDQTTGQITYNWQIPPGMSVGANYVLRVTASDGDKEGLAKTINKFGMISSGVDFSNTLRPVVTAKCAGAGCHVSIPAARNTRMDFWDSPQIGTSQFNGFRDRRRDIPLRTAADAAKPMPPVGSPALTAAERDLFQLWPMRQGLGGQAQLQGSTRPGTTANTLTAPTVNTAFTFDSVNTTTPTPIAVTWNISSLPTEPVTFEVLYAKSTDGFQAWTSLASGLTDQNYTWNVSASNFTPAADGGTRIRVVATSNNGRQNDRAVTTVQVSIKAAP